MIYVTQDTTQIKGTKLDLSVEITALLHHCFTEHIFTKEDALYFIDLASKTTEELKAESERRMNELKDMLKLFGDIL